MRFRPSIVGTLTMLFVCATTARLGVWQLQRHADRSAEADRRIAAHAAPPLTAWPEVLVPYQRITLEGRYTDATVATGGIPFSRNGYAAIGVFETTDGLRVLVNRGWIPADRWTRFLDAPPDTTVSGVLQPFDPSDVVPLTTDEGTRWPLERERFLFGLLTRGVRIPYDAIARAHDVSTQAALIVGPALADLEDRKTNALPAGGYTTYLKVFHHLEYAAQWFAFSALAFLIWVGLAFRRGRQPA